ncbi:MAG: hypothetical protein HOV80_38525 [Polyangiaceae bacterium]|nr:hypothetical protein [Polyangiaceae bacterium]
MRFFVFFALGALVAAAAAGCEEVDVSDGDGAGGAGAGPSTPRPIYEAGSRLTPRLISGGDGADVFVGFFDNELQIACSFMETDSGELRCLPENDIVGVALYADDACTVPAILETPCVTAPYATRFAQDPCHGYEPVEVFRAIDGSPPMPAYNLTMAGCFEFPEQTGGELRAAEAVPFSEFVLGTIERAGIEGDLAVHRIVAEDGASFVQTLLRDDFACEPRAFGTENRCVDVGAASMEVYEGMPLWAESTCSSSRAAFYGNPECLASGQMPGPLQTKMKPGLAVECTSQDCSTQAYYELDVDLAQVFTNEGMCTEYVVQALHAAAVGDPFPIEGLPAVETVQVGTGRLRALAWGHDGKALIGRPTFRDTTLGIECAAATVDGGTTRCLPEGTYPLYFADAACTVPLLQGTTEATRFLRIEEVSTPPSSCVAEITEVLERGAAHTGAAYTYNDTLPGCEVATNPGDLYTGTPKPLTDFAELTVN